MAIPIEQPKPDHVALDEGNVYFVDFVETDPDVYRVLAGAEDPEEAAHRVLRVGAKGSWSLRPTLMHRW